jgi:hypothetical protein
MAWVEFVWNWLDANNKQISALGSIVFGLSGAVVAWVALRLNYRNSYGWKPMVLLKTYGIGQAGGWTEVNCTFEVWNRRKYPIVVREVIVSFGNTKVDDEAPANFGEETEWHVTNRGMLVSSKNITVEPATRQDFDAGGPIKTGTGALGDGHSQIVIYVDIFDPRENRQVLLVERSERRVRMWWRPRRRMPDYRTWRPVRRRSKSAVG